MRNKKCQFFACCFMLCVALFPGLVWASDGKTERMSLQQDKTGGTVRGRVTDEQGEPIIGATVKAVGQPGGTITDIDGNYVLKFSEKPATITVSYIGYIGVGTNYYGQPEINVVMKEDLKMLDEVIVTGYQTISKERATGSFAILDEKTLSQKINLDMRSAIEGMVPGVTSYGSEGLIIRGRSTLSTSIGTEPLVVIDGMPIEMNIDNINMNDVEKMTFLKDAASTSIYGVRASNGVIVVTTKKGAIGKTQINVSADWKIDQNPGLSDFRYWSTGSYLNYEQKFLAYEASKSSRTELKYLDDNLVGAGTSTVIYYSPYYNLRHRYLKGEMSESDFNQTIADWKNRDYRQEYMDQIWRKPFKQVYNLSVSNASDKHNTYFSINYNGQAMQSKTNRADAIKAYLKNNFILSKSVSVNVGLDARYARSESLLSAYSMSNQFRQVEPYNQILDADGNKVYQDYSFTGNGTVPYIPSFAKLNPRIVSELDGFQPIDFDSYQFNILDELGNGSKTTGLDLRAFIDATFRLYKGLKFKTGFEYEVVKSQAEELLEANSYLMRSMRNVYISKNSETSYTRNIPFGGHFRLEDANTNNYTFRNQLDYEISLKENHHLTALAGFEMRENLNTYPVERIYYGYDPQTLNSVTLNNYDLSNSTLVPTSFMYNRRQGVLDLQNKQLTYLKNRYVSMYGAFGYTYKNLYNLTGSVRVDQANLFGTDEKYRYRPLWSIGAGWNVSNESFMKDCKWLNRLALRGSYGLTGNVDQTTSPYVLISSVSTAPSYIDPATPGYWLNPNNAPNPSLRWEQTTSYGAGIDFSVLKNLLNGRFDFYYRYSDDLLTDKTLPIATGYSRAKTNNGAMSNKGLEFSLNSPWFKTKDWLLSSTLIFSYNKNVIERVGVEPTNAMQLARTPGSYFREGKPRYSLYTFKYGGLASGGNNLQNGAPIILTQDGTPFYTINDNGAITYANSSTVSPSEVTYQGSLEPVWNGSFNQTVQYKSWELSALFTFYGGHKIRKPMFEYNIFGAPLSGSVSEIVDRSWTPDNTNTNIPKASIYYAPGAATALSNISDYWLYSDAQIAKGDMLRFRNLSLSYALPAKICKNLHLQNLRLTAQGNNLYFWSAAGDGIDPETYGLNSYSWSVSTQPSYLMRLEIGF